MGCVCCKGETDPHRKNSAKGNDLEADWGHVNRAAEVEETGDRYANEPRVARQRENPTADYASRRRTILSPHQIEVLLTEGKQVAKALYNYTGCSDDGTMDISAGEVLEIISWDGDWCFAKNLETDDEGFVPRTYVALENSLGCHGWFHGEVSRADAVKMLKAPNNKPGTFLIRQSETKEGSYSLSLLFESPSKGRSVKHYRIKNMDFGGCFLYESRTFESLVAMVDHYAKHDDDNRLSSPLLHSCPKQQPTIVDLSRTTRDNWEIQKSEIDLIELLGAGNFGEVWKGRWKKKIDVAVKMMKKGAMEPEKFLEEAAIMKHLQHPKIIRLYAVCTREQPFYIISELMPNGSLKDHLKYNDLDIQDIIYISTQVADGMWYIERESLIHRDLAARNVLMGENGLVKICDFGMAKVIDENVYVARQGAKCPIKWTAPEAISYNKYTIKSDVWSFGILLVEMTNGNGSSNPYPGMNNHELVPSLERGYRHPRPKNCPENLYDDVMLRCWDKNPDERPTFEELCKYLEDFPVD